MLWLGQGVQMITLTYTKIITRARNAAARRYLEKIMALLCAWIMLSTKVSKDIFLNVHKWNFKFGWNWNFYGLNRPWLNKLFSQAGSSWRVWRRLSLWFSYIWQKDVLQRSTCRSCLVWRRFSSNLQSWGKIPW